MSRNAAQIARLIQTLLRLSRGRLSLAWVLVLGALLIGYFAAQPYLERSLGVQLPGLADVAGPSGAKTETPAERSPPPAAESTASRASSVLRDVGRSVYESPAGLRYTPGSQHGHRLRHLMAHAADDPDRPGQHGVFDADDPAEVVLLIDEAFEQAESGRQTATKREQGRVIHTVDLGRRVGYIGGQSGNRKGRPAATRVRLVLEGRRLITAYPVRP